MLDFALRINRDRRTIVPSASFASPADTGEIQILAVEAIETAAAISEAINTVSIALRDLEAMATAEQQHRDDDIEWCTWRHLTELSLKTDRNVPVTSVVRADRLA